MKALITANAGGHGAVLLDGVDWSNAVRGFTLQSTVGHIPALTLDLLIFDQGAEVEVEVDLRPAVHDLLVRLGWTPPEQSSPTAAPALTGPQSAG